MIDCFTRWPEVVCLPDITAATVAVSLVQAWVARFGVPSLVTTDRGRQFESALFTQLTNLLGTSRTRTTAYHPAANGMVQRLHRRVKTAIMSVSPASWTDALPLTLLSLRATVKEDLQCSPAQMVYGTTLRLPGEFFAHPSSIVHTDPTTYPERLRTVMQALPAVRPRSPSQLFTYRHPLLETASHVFIRHDVPRKPLQPTYDGPY
ncbi:uncharacterized protein LOC135384353 [Ornithodoros turicata]|uniref:uncharacterized protein LOC135384353 n=1 Tax=Ornithodoros turicata TaxID=34597 RepID=UPI0031395592